MRTWADVFRDHVRGDATCEVQVRIESGEWAGYDIFHGSASRQWLSGYRRWENGEWVEVPGRWRYVHRSGLYLIMRSALPPRIEA